MKIFLIGYRCSGKTSTGQILARNISFGFLDTDRMVEQARGLNIAQIVQKYGWKQFREWEKQILFSTKNNESTVIATGGGIVTEPENQKFIKKHGFCVWLDADIKTILHRLDTDKKTSSSRPSLTDKDILNETRELLKIRNPLYEKIADLKIDVDNKTLKEIVSIIKRRLP